MFVDFRHLNKRYLFANPNILNGLWEDFEFANQFRERFATSRYDLHHSQRGEQAIARGRFPVAKDDVARLLTPKNRARFDHLLEHILVANISAQHADARISQRDFQAHIGHRSGNDRGTSQNAARLHVARDHQKYGIAIDHATVRVAEKGAIRIPIEGNT